MHGRFALPYSVGATGHEWLGFGTQKSYQQFAEVPLVNRIPDKTGYRLLARVQGSLVSTSFGNRILLVGGDCYCQGGSLGTMLVWR